MMLGLNEADGLAAGMRHEELRSEAGRYRSAGNLCADRPARWRGFAALSQGVGLLLLRMQTWLQGAPAAPEVGRGSGTSTEGRAPA